MTRWDVVVVGAGLAGLYCARILAAKGLRVAVFDRADAVGGRIRTDRVDGYCFDRGFQVLQTAYPEAKVAFDYPALKLFSYEPGAIIQTTSGRVVMADPWRRPKAAWATLTNGIGSLKDRWRLAKLRFDAAAEWGRPAKGINDHEDCSVDELLFSHYRFSGDFVNRFLRPWISGMFFDEQLRTSARFFKFVFHMLSTGDAALPHGGIQRLPEQIAGRLDPASIFLGCDVTKVREGFIELSDGQLHDTRAIVLAVPGHQLQQIVGDGVRIQFLPDFVATECCYFSTPTAPPIGKYLMLNGLLDREFQAGVISNVSVPSNVATSYAPEGSSLVCVNLRPSLVQASLAAPNSSDDSSFRLSEASIRAQLKEWFGSGVDDWTCLRSYKVAQAIPRWLPNHHSSEQNNVPAWLHLCGDYLESPSIQGALVSGKRTAHRVLVDLDISR